MITLQHVTKAIAVALMLLMLPGCTSIELAVDLYKNCLLYTSPSPRDATLSRMPSSA